MNILITAGGTSEKIDEVRTISNMSTGRLGSLIADSFLKRSDVSVTYICPEGASLPQNSRAKIFFIDSVQSLQTALKAALQEQLFDAVVHSMAVSDYSVKYSVPSDDLSDCIAAHLQTYKAPLDDMEKLSAQIQAAMLMYNNEQKNQGKISSEIDHLVVCLEKTPKIIRIFKKHQPNTILVGFKLLVDVEESQLLLAAKKLMETNHCDFVLANDLMQIQGTQHRAILLDTEHTTRFMETKEEIAEQITDSIIRKAKGDQK
jgi:phosphopantothenate---cysteine ligase (CTP)